MRQTHMISLCEADFFSMQQEGKATASSPAHSIIKPMEVYDDHGEKTVLQEAKSR